MATLFSKIIAGEVPCHKIAENDEFFAFLDIRPVRDGHTLVIPKIEVDEFFSIEAGLLGRMMQFCQQVAQTLKAAIPCNRVGVIISGLEVPHAHVHLVPFFKARQLKDEPTLRTLEELAPIAELIKAKIK